MTVKATAHSSNDRDQASASAPGQGMQWPMYREDGDVHYVHHPSFSLPQTEKRLCGKGYEAIEVGHYDLLPALADENAIPTCRSTTLTTEQERKLFLRYNYCKYRMNRIAKLRRKRDTARRQRESRQWRGRAQAAREKLVHANLPLAPAMAKRQRLGHVEFTEKVSEGYMTILRCIEHFDVSRGYKFSTYACRALIACFYRMETKAQTYRRYVAAQFELAHEQDDANQQRHEQQRDFAIDSVRRVLLDNRADLTPVERQVIEERFPIGRQRKPKALWQVGRSLGVSTERARQIQNTSLSKLQEALKDYLLT